MKYGFRRNPKTKDSQPKIWDKVWQQCKTVIGHSTSRDRILSFSQLCENATAYYLQEGEEIPSDYEYALDMIQLLEVGLVLVEADLDDRIV